MGTIVNDRDKEARNAAYDEYDSEYHSDDNYGLEVDCFRDGVKWADRNPSEESIEKFIQLFYAANKEIRSRYGTPLDMFDRLKEEQINYIKEHWND